MTKMIPKFLWHTGYGIRATNPKEPHQLNFDPPEHPNYIKIPQETKNSEKKKLIFNKAYKMTVIDG